MTTLVNINGKFFPDGKASISVFDRGFLFGDSIFEVLRTYNGRLFAFDMHMDRLEQSAAQISFKLPLSREAIFREMTRTVKKTGNHESYVRIVVTRGASSKIGMDPSTAANPQAIIIVQDFQPPPEDISKRAVRAALVTLRRNPSDSLAPSIKSGNYLNSVLAHIEAKSAGAAEAIMLNHQGNVTEGTVFNLFIVSGGEILTPPLSAGILDGITRKVIIRQAREAGLKFKEANFNGKRLLQADEVFFTSTLREVQPVVKIGETVIGGGKPGPVTTRVLQIFREAVEPYLS
ncbi:MAG: aminotransferase class IV [Myxococcota bacterium]|jgi:branched-chain amino acid aminotransferase